jgi:hypothetical protein
MYRSGPRLAQEGKTLGITFDIFKPENRAPHTTAHGGEGRSLQIPVYLLVDFNQLPLLLQAVNELPDARHLFLLASLSRKGFFELFQDFYVDIPGL